MASTTIPDYQALLRNLMVELLDVGSLVDHDLKVTAAVGSARKKIAEALVALSNVDAELSRALGRSASQAGSS